MNDKTYHNGYTEGLKHGKHIAFEDKALTAVISFCIGFIVTIIMTILIFKA